MTDKRYLKNGHAISEKEQRTLSKKAVAIVGCGGLGGHVIELLSRLGVENLTVFDPDTFEETNLNRQILCTAGNIGESKVLAAKERIASINPSVKITAVEEKFTENNSSIIAGHDLIIDAVDSIPARLELQECAEKMGIPLVHGAIGGWYGQVCSVFPGDGTLTKIYRNFQRHEAEKPPGNISFMASLIASLQSCEALKILLKKGTPIRNGVLLVNPLNNKSHFIKL